jgi:hypothetical protein
VRDYCVRCGSRLESRRKKDEVLCGSCRAKPAKTVKWGDDVCIPWRGDFDFDDNPLRFGVLYLPGMRVCNHRDCVNPTHIVDVI